MRSLIEWTTTRREELVDITGQVEGRVRVSGVYDGLVALSAQGVTAAVLIPEHWVESVAEAVPERLRRLVPRERWRHDRHDGNGDTHIEAGLVGPWQTLPLLEGRLGHSTGQGKFFCEFDGPRARRSLVCTILPDRSP